MRGPPETSQLREPLAAYPNLRTFACCDYVLHVLAIRTNEPFHDTEIFVIVDADGNPLEIWEAFAPVIWSLFNRRLP